MSDRLTEVEEMLELVLDEVATLTARLEKQESEMANRQKELTKLRNVLRDNGVSISRVKKEQAPADFKAEVAAALSTQAQPPKPAPIGTQAERKTFLCSSCTNNQPGGKQSGRVFHAKPTTCNDHGVLAKVAEKDRTAYDRQVLEAIAAASA